MGKMAPPAKVRTLPKGTSRLGARLARPWDVRGQPCLAGPPPEPDA